MCLLKAPSPFFFSLLSLLAASCLWTHLSPYSGRQCSPGQWLSQGAVFLLLDAQGLMFPLQ